MRRSTRATHASSYAARVRMMHPTHPAWNHSKETHVFNPLKSEIYGWTKHCRDCGKLEADHKD